MYFATKMIFKYNGIIELCELGGHMIYVVTLKLWGVSLRNEGLNMKSTSGVTMILIWSTLDTFDFPNGCIVVNQGRHFAPVWKN